MSSPHKVVSIISDRDPMSEISSTTIGLCDSALALAEDYILSTGKDQLMHQMDRTALFAFCASVFVRLAIEINLKQLL